MILTQRQANLIDNYLKKVEDLLDPGVSDEFKKRAIAELKENIFSILRRSEKSHINDDELVMILKEQLGPPEVQAKRMIHPKDPTRELILNQEKRIWLGVCSGIATRFKLPILLIRFLFVIFGLVIGVGLFLYICIYFYLYLTSGVYRGKSVRCGTLVGQFILTIFLITLSFVITLLILKGAEYLHTYYVNNPTEGSTQILKQVKNIIFLLFVFFLWTGSLSGIMGGLPLKNDWDKTFRNVRNAQLALFIFLDFIGITIVCIKFIIDAVQVIKNLVV